MHILCIYMRHNIIQDDTFLIILMRLVYFFLFTSTLAHFNECSKIDCY